MLLETIRYRAATIITSWAKLLPDVYSMLTRFIKIAIALIYYNCSQTLGLIGRLFGMPPRGNTVVIYYHRVTRKDAARFARQMDHLLRWAEPVTVNELDSDSLKPRRVAVTADDGWLSFFENALPELEKRNIPVAIFVVSHRLGDNLGTETDRLISESELRSLRRDLVTVGSHTATHIRLATAPVSEGRRELLESRARLSQLLETDIRLFCFPFGAHDDESVALCRAAGYTRAFGAQATPSARLPGAFLVERIRVDPSDWPIEFHLKVLGAYRGLWAAALLKKELQSATSLALSKLSSAVKYRSILKPQNLTATHQHSEIDS